MLKTGQKVTVTHTPPGCGPISYQATVVDPKDVLGADVEDVALANAWDFNGYTLIQSSHSHKYIWVANSAITVNQG